MKEGHVVVGGGELTAAACPKQLRADGGKAHVGQRHGRTASRYRKLELAARDGGSVG